MYIESRQDKVWSVASPSLANVLWPYSPISWLQGWPEKCRLPEPVNNLALRTDQQHFRSYNLTIFRIFRPRPALAEFLEYRAKIADNFRRNFPLVEYW